MCSTCLCRLSTWESMLFFVYLLWALGFVKLSKKQILMFFFLIFFYWTNFREFPSYDLWGHGDVSWRSWGSWFRLQWHCQETSVHGGNGVGGVSWIGWDANLLNRDPLTAQMGWLFLRPHKSTCEMRFVLKMQEFLVDVSIQICWTGANTALVFHSLTCASTQQPQVVNVEAGKNKGRTGSLEIY